MPLCDMMTVGFCLTVVLAFQWPLIGHAPLRRGWSFGGFNRKAGVSMASDRPCPSATQPMREAQKLESVMFNGFNGL